jgi:hypothetical protein
MEERHLAIANRNIAEGEARVERQLALIERMNLRGGGDTDAAERFLDLLRQMLESWKHERDMIVEALEG